MAMRARGSLKRAMVGAAQPYLGLGRAAGGPVVAARAAARRGEPRPGDAWTRRHRDACASGRRAVVDGRRRRGLAPLPG
jgi:hypothetical protein